MIFDGNGSRVFDGNELGVFDETDTQQSDTYSYNKIRRWYGGFVEEKNDRTQFVLSRAVDFSDLSHAMFLRWNAISHLDEHTRRELKLSESEYNVKMNESTRGLVISNLMIGIDYRAIINAIDRYAWSAPSETKIAAGVEYGIWMLRQPAGANNVNGLVRSGAATLLDPYKYRGI